MELERIQPGQQLSAAELRRVANQVLKSRPPKGGQAGAPVGYIHNTGGDTPYTDDNYWYYGEVINVTDPGGGDPIRYGLKEVVQNFKTGTWEDKVGGFNFDGTVGDVYALAPEGMEYSEGDRVKARRHSTNQQLWETEPFAITTSGAPIFGRVTAGTDYGPYTVRRLDHLGGDSYADHVPTTDYEECYWLHSNIQPPDIAYGQYVFLYPSSISGQYLMDARGSQKSLSSYVCIPQRPQLVCAATGWELIWDDVALVIEVESRDLKRLTLGTEPCPP